MISYPIKTDSSYGPESVVYVHMPVEPPSYKRYPKNLSIGLGVMQILFGALCISLPLYGGLDGESMYGIWCGTLVSG